MDNQYKYLRRLSNQSQPNQNEEEIATNRTEILKPTKTIERVNIKNLYLQRLLSNNSPSPTSFSSVNETLPSFTNNLRDILSSTYNKQRAIKYLINKRRIEQYGLRSPYTDYDQEETNPVFSNKYLTDINNVNQNRTINVSKNVYLNFSSKTNDNLNDRIEINNKKDTKKIFKKKFLLSEKNCLYKNKDNEGEEENNFYNTFYIKKSWHDNQNMEPNMDKDIDPNNDNKNKTQHRFYRGYSQKNDNKDEINDEEIIIKDKNKTPVRKNHNLGYSLSFGKPEDYIDNEAGIYKKKNNKNKNIGNLISKNYTYIRQRYKKNKAVKNDKNNENVKEKDKENNKEKVKENNKESLKVNVKVNVKGNLNKENVKENKKENNKEENNKENVKENVKNNVKENVKENVIELNINPKNRPKNRPTSGTFYAWQGSTNRTTSFH